MPAYLLAVQLRVDAVDRSLTHWPAAARMHMRSQPHALGDAYLWTPFSAASTHIQNYPTPTRC